MSDETTRAPRFFGAPLASDRLPPLSAFVAELAAAAANDADFDGRELGMYVETLDVDLPFELELVDDGAGLTLGAAPPTQRTETTVLPVWHRLRVTIVACDAAEGPAGVRGSDGVACHAPAATGEAADA
jgi:hypothetical protein